jgi:hypothetical protein
VFRLPFSSPLKRLVVYAQRRHDGTILVHTDGEPLRTEHVRRAEDRAQTLAAICEEEVLYSGSDVEVLVDYESAYWNFAEHSRFKLAKKAKERPASVAREPRYRYVVICTEQRSGRIRGHIYRTHGKLTRAEAAAAGRFKHPLAQVTVIPLKKGHRAA